jgi:hypothetical protein
MLTTFNALPWWLHPALGVVLLGLLLVGRGLAGDRGGARGLLRRGAGALGRVEGWRMLLFGLTLTGLGLAWFWELRWLLFLTLAIGFVELQEASMIIRAWRASERMAATRARNVQISDSHESTRAGAARAPRCARTGRA